MLSNLAARLGGGKIGVVVALFALLSAGPLGLLTYASLEWSKDAVRHEVQATLRSTVSASAAFITQRTQSLEAIAAAFSKQPALYEALTAGPGNATLQGLLEQLHITQPNIASVFALDELGNVLAVEPPRQGAVGSNFSKKPCYQHTRDRLTPYVSPVIFSLAVGHPRAFSVCTRVVDAHGTPVGMIGLTYKTEPLQEFVENFASIEHIMMRIVDAGGVLVAAADANTLTDLTSQKDDVLVAAVLRGEASVSEATEGMLTAYEPLPSLGWGIIGSKSSKEAFAALARLRTAELILAGILSFVLITGLVFVGFTLIANQRAQSALQQSEAQNVGILGNARDAYISIEQGRVTEWNHQAELTFGWPESETIGKPLTELIIPKRFREGHAHGLAAAERTGQGPVINNRIEISAIHRDGHEFPVELAVWATKSNDHYVFHSLIHDISDRKRNEMELAQTRDQAMEASRLKSAFLANMSHEIRTPLNGIIGMTYLLLNTTLDAQQREYASMVRRSGEALLIVLNDILDLSKIEAGKLQLEAIDFDLHSLLSDVIRMFADVASSKGIELGHTIENQVPQRVCGDPGRLRQVLLNLVSNAVKFTEEGTVSLRAVFLGREDRGLRLRFIVQDTGIGVSEEIRDSLFKAFTQADASTTRRYGGSGLGLAICSQLAELMGGELTMSSIPGRGSTFSFTLHQLPATTTPAQVLGAAPNAQPGLPTRILVVEDNVVNQKLVVGLLTQRGYAVDVASNGLEGVDALQAGHYAVVLMDCHMPTMDGFTATAEIRRRESSERRVPIIALTASAMVDDQNKCRAAGMDDFVAKPIVPAQLFAVLDRWAAPTKTAPEV